LNFIGRTDLGSSPSHHPVELADVACPERITVLGQLTAALGHELAQPLLAALNYLTVAADCCNRDPKLDPRLCESVMHSLAQVDRAARISRHVRLFAMKGVPSKESFDLNTLLRFCLEQFERPDGTGQVQLRFQAQPGRPSVLADPVLVQQVVLNLLRNASQAMEALPPEERIIHVSSAVHDAGHARVTIRDHGPGLPENTELMTKPFLTSKREGLGLGLWLSRTIVEANDGRFWAEKSASGGAALSFTLPLADGANQWNS